MSASYQRAWVLYFELKRYDLAEQELRGVLVDKPGDALAHSLLSLCLIHRQQYQEASAEVKEAMRSAPNLAFAHYAKARLLGARNMLPAARSAINEAIRLDPMQADYFSWLAAFLYDSGQWKAALKAADQGLELNAQHVSCANLRALSLAKLGRQAEAKATSLAALARDPVNAVSHAIQATTLMRQADYGQARANYMEALRLDPLCEWAHRGRVYARWGGLFTTAPRTIGRAVLELLRRPIPRLGGVSDKKAAWVGCIVFVALNAAATGLVDRNWVTGLYTMAYGLAALLLIGMGSLVRGFLTGVAWGLSFCIAVPFFVEILVISELVHPTNAEARLLNQVAYLLSGVAVLGVLSFVFGIMQAGMLADLSLPRRKPEQPPASRP